MTATWSGEERTVQQMPSHHHRHRRPNRRGDSRASRCPVSLLRDDDAAAEADDAATREVGTLRPPLVVVACLLLLFACRWAGRVVGGDGDGDATIPLVVAASAPPASTHPVASRHRHRLACFSGSVGPPPLSPFSPGVGVGVGGVGVGVRVRVVGGSYLGAGHSPPVAAVAIATSVSDRWRRRRRRRRLVRVGAWGTSGTTSMDCYDDDDDVVSLYPHPSTRSRSEGDDDDRSEQNGGYDADVHRYLIRFSESFQRHVVYRYRERLRRRYTTDADADADADDDDILDSDDDVDVVESFDFLDEAVESYPEAEVEDQSSPRQLRHVALGSRMGESEGDSDCDEGRPSAPVAADAGLEDDEEEAATRAALRRLAELVVLSRNGNGDGNGNGNGNGNGDGKAGGSSADAMDVDEAARRLGDWIGLDRFRGHRPSSIKRNYDRFIRLVAGGVGEPKEGGDKGERAVDGGAGCVDGDRGGGGGVGLLDLTPSDAMTLIRNFPKVCLYDPDELEGRVRFLTSPLPPTNRTAPGVETGEATNATAKGRGGRGRRKGKSFAAKAVGRDEDEVDWPRLAHEGYGAGLTRRQATDAILAVPELLATHLEDGRKPPMPYYLHSHRRGGDGQHHLGGVSWEGCDEVRNALGGRVAGCDAGDVCCFAYLRKLGVGWGSMTALIDAFPAVRCCDLEVPWEVEGPAPKRGLDGGLVHYLRRRLRTDPMHVHSMIKTHPTLGAYSADRRVRPTLDAIQSSIGLSSQELRRIVLRMPSLLGMSVPGASGGSGSSSRAHGPSALDRRLDFFFGEVGLSQAELRTALLKQPSLLQYSVDAGLRPKLEFLTRELSIPPESIPRLICTSPAIFGLSLVHNLRPTVEVLMDRCALSADEVGIVVCTSPPVLTLSTKRKIEPCLSFLYDSLLLSGRRELGFLVLTAPRLLLHSVDTSLAPKLAFLRDAVERERRIASSGQDAILERASSPSCEIEAATLVKRNPSLLVTTNGILRRRLDKELARGGECSLRDALGPSTRGRRRQYRATIEMPSDPADDSSTSDDDLLLDSVRPKRVVLELSCDREKVLRVFPSVKVASKKTGCSLSLIYRACSKGATAKGRRFTYAVRGERAETGSIQAEPVVGLLGDTPSFKSPRSTENLLGSFAGSIEGAKSASHSGPPHLSDDDTVSNVSATVLVSGRVYPADDMRTVRGARKAGGTALYFPQVSGGSGASARHLERAAKCCFGVVYPGGLTDVSLGRICVPFPFLRPSRRRCDLYACHAALKLVLEALKQTPNDMSKVDVRICIVTDSAYAWNLLNDVERLSRWAQMPNMDAYLLGYDIDCSVTGSDVLCSMPVSMTNPDLLYPLSQTFGRLSQCKANDLQGREVSLGRSVEVEFRLLSEPEFAAQFSQYEWATLADSATATAKLTHTAKFQNVA